MNYQIIATLGPASSTPAIWKKMLSAGATAFRLNTSHLELAGILEWLEQLSIVSNESETQFPVILDMQGSKWRIGQIESQVLAEGQIVELISAPVSQNKSQIPVPHLDFFTAAPHSSRRIVLNDARVILSRQAAGPDWLKARVIQAGEISTRKGITYAVSDYRNENLTDKDREVYQATQGYSQIQYALSYVRDSTEMAHYRKIFGNSSSLIAKIERPTAVDGALEISKAADEIWLCRGDLGAELGLASMAKVVFQFTRGLDRLAIPVLMAGQVLEHMSRHPQPTRSEVCHLVDCLEAGYHGFVLSDETAIGQFPVESCQVVASFKDEEPV